MSVRPSGFWGLVEQKGPWKPTANDVRRSMTSNPATTKHAGHAGFYSNLRPSDLGNKMPPVVVPKYTQKSVKTGMPLGTPKTAKGRIVHSYPVESMTAKQTGVQKAGYANVNVPTGFHVGGDSDGPDAPPYQEERMPDLQVESESSSYGTADGSSTTGGDYSNHPLYQNLTNAMNEYLESQVVTARQLPTFEDTYMEPIVENPIEYVTDPTTAQGVNLNPTSETDVYPTPSTSAADAQKQAKDREMDLRYKKLYKEFQKAQGPKRKLTRANQSGPSKGKRDEKLKDIAEKATKAFNQSQQQEKNRENLTKQKARRAQSYKEFKEFTEERRKRVTKAQPRKPRTKKPAAEPSEPKPKPKPKPEPKTKPSKPASSTEGEPSRLEAHVTNTYTTEDLDRLISERQKAIDVLKKKKKLTKKQEGVLLNQEADLRKLKKMRGKRPKK